MRAGSKALGLVAAGCVLGSALGQGGECTASTDASFDYQVVAEDGFTVYWTVDTAAEEVTMQVVFDGEGYVGLGFSSTGAMVPADAVVGLPDEGTALEYDLSRSALSSDNEHETQEISGASVTQANSTTILVFTRPLSPTDDSKTVLSAEEGEEATFIWAYGNSNTFQYHGARGDFTVSDLLCSEVVEEEDDDSEGDDAAAAETAAENCASSDPDFEYEVAPHEDLALFWSVVGTSVSVKAVYQGEGYLSIGFSDSGNMPGSDAVIGLPDEATALEYDMDSYGMPEEAADQEISNATITQVDGVTTLTFVRLLEPSGDGKQILSVSEPTPWLYAWGGSNTFQQHSTRGAVSLTLDSCTVGDAGGGGTSTEYAHGWLMALGWTLCFPAGIMYARFSRSFKDIGFPAHRLLQSLGSVLVIIGFFCAVAFTEDFGLDHFSNAHGKAGLVLTIFVMLQVVAAVCRPSKPPAGAVVQDANGQAKPAPVSKVRQAWTLLHRGLGYITVIWAVFQCLGGLDLLEVDDVWWALYFFLVIAAITAFVVLQTLACCRSKRDEPVDYSRPRSQAGSVPAYTGTRRP
ncbi:unnamed protein product [Ectocarpus sp. 12 AP-2014]